MYAPWWRAFCGCVRRNGVSLGVLLGYGSEHWWIAWQFNTLHDFGVRNLLHTLDLRRRLLYGYSRQLYEYARLSQNLKGCNGYDGCGRGHPAAHFPTLVSPMGFIGTPNGFHWYPPMGFIGTPNGFHWYPQRVSLVPPTGFIGTPNGFHWYPQSVSYHTSHS